MFSLLPPFEKSWNNRIKRFLGFFFFCSRKDWKKAVDVSDRTHAVTWSPGGFLFSDGVEDEVVSHMVYVCCSKI